MMRDHAELPPLVVDCARVTLAELTEEQRLALAHEIVSGARLRSSALQLTCIATHAQIVADELRLADFVEKEMRKCL